jgi:hypothetical protein
MDAPVTLKYTAPAVTEPGTSKDEYYTHMITVHAGSTDKGRYKIWDMISDLLEGAGPVDLVKFDLKFSASDAKQSLHFGSARAGTTRTASELAGKPNGIYYCSNSYNYGEERNHTFVPETIMSMRLVPETDSNLPFEIVYTKSAGLNLWFHIYVDVHGPITRFVTLK